MHSSVYIQDARLSHQTEGRAWNLSWSRFLVRYYRGRLQNQPENANSNAVLKKPTVNCILGKRLFRLYVHYDMHWNII